MQLFNLLKQAQSNNGPNESADNKGGSAVDQHNNQIKRQNNAESKEEEFISHNDSNHQGDNGNDQYAVGRIDEVEEEKEQNTYSDAEAYDSDEAEQQRMKNLQQKQRRQSNNQDRDHQQQQKAIGGHRDSRDSKNGTVFNVNGNKGGQAVKQSMDSSNRLQRSFEGVLVQSPNSSGQGPKCFFAPENVEQRSPQQHNDQNLNLDESLSQFSPRQIANAQPIDIYIDQDSPKQIVTSAHFAKANSAMGTAVAHPQNDNETERNQVKIDPEMMKVMRQNNSFDSEASPRINNDSPKKRFSHRDSQRNYFQRNQENKARRTMRSSQKSLKDSIDVEIENKQEFKNAQDISQHDQNLGIRNEHHDSQHDQDQMLIFGNDGLKKINDSSGENETIEGGMNGGMQQQQQWHDVKVIQSEDGSQELVIENLENLQDTTALIVTRGEGGQFKIGIQQDNTSEVMSQAPSNHNNAQNSALINKIKLRGKFGGNTSKQSNSGMPALNSSKVQQQYRTISVNSQDRRSSKQSIRSRIAMPQISSNTGNHTQMVAQNKYKTFQDPNQIRFNTINYNNSKQLQQDNDQESNAPFRKRIRESASDNKRLLGEEPSPRKRNVSGELEMRSNIQSAQAEEIIRKSRDTSKHMNKMMHHSRSQQRSPGQESQNSRYQNNPNAGEQNNSNLGYVKIIDPLKQGLGNIQKDPNDRSDSKLGPTTFSNNLGGRNQQLSPRQQEDQGGDVVVLPAAGALLGQTPLSSQQYQKSTHRANSSVHSRDNLNAQLFKTPEIKHSSMISKKIRDQHQMMNNTGNIGGNKPPALDQSLSSFVAGGNAQLSLAVKQGKKDSFQKLKSGVNKPMAAYHHPLYEPVGIMSHHQRTPQPMMNYHGQHQDTIHVDMTSDALPGGPITEEARSRASVISRRSNADMKGENLVKFSPRNPGKGVHEQHLQYQHNDIASLRNSNDKHDNGDVMARATNAPVVATLASSKLTTPRGDSSMPLKNNDLSGGSAPDKQIGGADGEVLPIHNSVEMAPGHQASPPRPQELQQKQPLKQQFQAEVAPKNASGSPLRNSASRTDTAFYDGKVSQTEGKLKGQPIGSKLVEKQLSETAPQDVQSNNGPITAARQELNYHTANEDAGDGYFPQILKYTENAPQESILSRDNYSTSAHPSAISRKIQAPQAASLAPKGSSRVKKYYNKQRSDDQIQPVNNSRQSVQAEVQSPKQPKQPLNVMNQNVARVEKQNPSTKASILSHSIQGDDDRADLNQRASSLEHVSEENPGDKSQLNKDGSSYNIATSDITAIPQAKKSPKATERSSPRVTGKNKKIESPKVPFLDMKNMNPSSEAELSPERSIKIKQPVLQQQRSKESIHSQAMRSSQHRGQLSKLSNTQRSKASLASRKSRKGNESSARTQSMLPSLGRASEITGDRNPVALRSSNRVQPNKKSDRSTTLPLQQNSAKKGQPQYNQPSNNSNLIVASSGVPNHQIQQNNQAVAAPMKLPSMTNHNPVVGQHLAAPGKSGRAADGGASMRNSPPGGRSVDNQSMLDTMAQNQQNVAATVDGEKPIMKYMEASDAEQKSYPLKYFKGQDLELYYMEKQLKPGVEREIKEGFFEIRKKFGEGQTAGEEVQVYVSHLCLHNYHPIFCKFNLDVVKTILNFSQIIYLNKGQVLYEQGYNDRYLYVILFGKLRISQHETDAPIGQPLNIGWTVGEEILFKSDRKANGGQRLERCRSLCESCVLGIEKRSLAQIKRTLVERGQAEEFVKLEVVLRGNYLVKKAWRA